MDITGYRNAVTFADTLDTILGGDLDDYPERATDACRGHRNPGFYVFQFHCRYPKLNFTLL